MSTALIFILATVFLLLRHRENMALISLIRDLTGTEEEEEAEEEEEEEEDEDGIPPRLRAVLLRIPRDRN